MTPSPLFRIVAHARAGALDQAWRLFAEAGLEGADDDPAVLSVRGRLLKDRALLASGPERRTFYREAADAYGRAGEISGATYPLINAASLALLSGDAEQAARRAAEVLARVEAGADGAETPYWRDATRAEALLLLGRTAEAGAALADALAVAPRAWEDHASTLRQFALILQAQGQDAAWLDAHRPPRCLHFAGHMGLAAEDAATATAVADWLERERVGFGYGALAAGADLVIAEALLARGAELHVVLPAPAGAFRAASATGAWGARFDAALARAETVRVTGGGADALSVRLAAEAAMGAAVMQARLLCTEAVQLVVLDEADGDSGAMAEAWATSGRRQGRIEAARAGARPGRRAADPEMRLTAVVAVALEPARLADAAAVLKGRGAGRWTGEGMLLNFAGPREAATAALELATALKAESPVRIACAYGRVRTMADPFGAGEVLSGAAAEAPLRMLDAVPPDAILVSEDFAAALNAGPEAGRPRTEYVGDLPGSEPGAETRLFALKPAPQG